MNTIDLLKKWLKKKGNSKALMAARLGYKTSVTITQWINKNEIPLYVEDQVITIIKEKK